MRFKKVVSPESVQSLESAFSIARGERVISRGILTSRSMVSRLKRYRLCAYQIQTFHAIISVSTGSQIGEVPSTHPKAKSRRLGICSDRTLKRPIKSTLKNKQREIPHWLPIKPSVMT